ncbi:MAG: DUF1178 family protein [Burkholderiaceae bacterium]|nr:DUF1178 family protein [Burkholderiaceae bacterium]
MGLKVYNFRCAEGHVFEAMLPSAKEADRQASNALLTCPICDSTVKRQLSAPHVKRSQNKEISNPNSHTSDVERLQALLKQIEEIAEKSEDVGERFVDEARAIHRGDAPVRNIRGGATGEEVQELLEEGIPVMPYVPKKNSVN